MNLLQRIGRLEKLRANASVDGFIITHAEFLTLTLAEIALRSPEVDNKAGVGASAANIEGATRISGIRYHPRRIAAPRNVSPVSRIAWTEHVEEIAAAMRPRILRMKDAFESGDRTAYRRQQGKDRKALLARAEAIIDRVEAEIARMPQTAG